MIAVEPPPFSPRSARAAEQAKAELAGKPSLKHEGSAKLASTLPAGAKRKKKKGEPPLKLDRRKASFAVIDRACRVAQGGQGRTYWSAVCHPPVQPGKRRTAKFVFTATSGAMAGAVGMLPPTASKSDLQDWLGWQVHSAALWLDGTCRQNGKKLGEVSATDISQSEALVCEHDGTALTVWRNGEALRRFDGVPSDWCFAAGAFGGNVRLMREHDDVGGQIPRCCFSKITALNVPDADMGSGGSDVYVTFELRREDGSLFTAKPLMARTSTLEEAGETCEFSDSIALPLPAESFSSGTLEITVCDEDDGDDCVIGRASHPIEISTEVVKVENVVVAGQPQPGAAGYAFPDFEISFEFEFKGSFA